MASPYFKALNEKRTTNILTAMGQYAAVDITNRRNMPDDSPQAQGEGQQSPACNWPSTAAATASASSTTSHYSPDMGTGGCITIWASTELCS